MTAKYVPRRGVPLGGREVQCLAGAANGLTSAQIGVVLGIAENTVKRHLSRAFVKLGACDRAQAVWLAGVGGQLTRADVEVVRRRRWSGGGGAGGFVGVPAGLG